MVTTEKIIQFGEGGFLRGFADWMIQKMTDCGAFEGKVVVVQPIEQGMCDMLTAQNCVYTHVIRGVEGVAVQQDAVGLRRITAGTSALYATQFIPYFIGKRHDLTYLWKFRHPQHRQECRPLVQDGHQNGQKPFAGYVG